MDKDITKEVAVWKLKRAFKTMRRVGKLIPIKIRNTETCFYTCIFGYGDKIYRVYTNNALGEIFQDLTVEGEANALCTEVEAVRVSFIKYKNKQTKENKEIK